MKTYENRINQLSKALTEFKEVVDRKKEITTKIIELQITLNGYYKDYHVNQIVTPKHKIKEAEWEMKNLKEELSSVNDEIAYYKSAINFIELVRDIESLELISDLNKNEPN